MEAKLVVVGGKANMGEVKLRLPMTIGRGNKADLIISHPTVSRIHCKLSEVDGLLVVRDNSSSNGTFVDSKQVTESVVRPGQQLKIGPITFRAEYDIAEVLPAPVANDSGPAMAETQSLDRDNFDFLADEMFGEPAATEEKTAKAPKLPAPAKPKSKPQPAEAKKSAPAPTKLAKQAPPNVSDETAVFTPGAAVEFNDIDEPSTPSGAAATVDVPAEPAASPAADMNFDFLGDLKFDAADAAPGDAPAATETSAVTPPVIEPPPPVAPAPAVEAEKVSADDFDFLSELEPEAAVESPAAKSDEPKFFEPQPTEPAVSLDFTGDLGIAETKPFHMPHIPAAEEPVVPPTAEPESEKIAAADFDFLSELEPEATAEAPVVQPPSAPVEPEAAAPQISEPEVAEPEAIVTKTVSTEELDLVFDFDEAVSTPSAETPVMEESVAPVAEEPQWPGVVETPAAEQPAAADFAFDFEAESVAAAPAEPVPFTPDAEAPAPEPEIAAEWSPPSEVVEPVAPQPADAFDFLADEPAAAAPAVPAFEPEAAPVAEEKFFEPAPSEPAVAFDFTGDLGLGETQQFAMPQETPDPNPPAFAFEPAAEAAPSAEPEAPAFAAEVESPFAAPVPFAASPVAPSRAAAQPAAPKLSFVDKIKMLLGLGGAKKKGAAKKGAKASPAGGLEATAAAAAAPIAVPKFGSSIAADAPIPLAEDAPIPLFGEEPIAASQAIDDAAPQIHVTPPEGAAESLFDELAMMDAEPAAPVTESPALAGIAPPVEEPKVDVAPEIEVAPPAGEAESLFDELAMMEGAPSADSPGLTFGEPPAIHHPVAFHFTSDLGLAESKPFELPHTPAAAEPVIPPLVESSPADVAPVADEAQSLFDELEMMSGAPSADSLGPKFSEPATTQPHVSIDFTGNLGIGETKHFAMPHTPAAETPAAASSDAFDDFLADLAPAAETPAVEPPAEISPIAAAAEEAKSELHDLFASFTGAEAEPQAAAEPSAPVAVEPVLEAPAIEVAPPTGEANSLLDELAMMEGAPSADSLGHKLSEAVDSHPAVSIDFTGDLGLADSKPFEMPHTHDAEAAPSPLAEAAAAELAVTETPGAEASPFDELFAPDDQPELAAADANSSTPLDVTTNFVPPQDLQPEPASPFTWDEPVASPTSEAADIPISAELAAPMMGVAQEIAAPVESPVIGATRPYVIDVDVRHTYLNRLAVRIAAKMSKLDIPDLEPEMPAGRSFNRVGKPPESMPTVEAPAAGEALFVTSEVADVPAPAFDSWQQQGVEDSPAAFAAEAAFDMPETSVEASIADPPAADVIDLASLFGESTPAESVADAAPPSTEGLTALFTMPMEDTPAAPEAAALPSLEEPKPDAQAKAESKPKDDDLDSFLNDLGMG